MIKKFTAMLACVLLLLAAFTVSASADVWQETNEKTGYVAVIDDAAGLLKASDMDSVREELRRLTQYCNAGFCTAGTEAGSSNVLRKAESWGEANLKKYGEYTVLMIDMSTRRIGIYSSDKIFKTLTTGKTETITDNVYSYASNKQYGTCAKKALSQMANLLAGENIAEPMKVVSNVLLAIAVSILLAFLIISSRKLSEQEVSLPTVVTATAAGVGTTILGSTLVRTVRHSSSGGSHGGGHGGGFGGGGGHSGGGGGSHGF